MNPVQTLLCVKRGADHLPWPGAEALASPCLAAHAEVARDLQLLKLVSCYTLVLKGDERNDREVRLSGLSCSAAP